MIDANDWELAAADDEYRPSEDELREADEALADELARDEHDKYLRENVL